MTKFENAGLAFKIFITDEKAFPRGLELSIAYTKFTPNRFM